MLLPDYGVQHMRAAVALLAEEAMRIVLDQRGLLLGHAPTDNKVIRELCSFDFHHIRLAVFGKELKELYTASMAPMNMGMLYHVDDRLLDAAYSVGMVEWI